MSDLIRIDVTMAALAGADDPERLDEFTRGLLLDVREQRVESAELVRDRAAPRGAKGGLEVAAAIAIGLTTNAFWDVAKMLMSRLRNQPGAVIRVDGPVAGRPLKFEGTPAELAALLERLATRPGTAPTDAP